MDTLRGLEGSVRTDWTWRHLEASLPFFVPVRWIPSNPSLCFSPSRLFGDSRSADIRPAGLPPGEDQAVAALDEGTHLRPGLHCVRHHLWSRHHSRQIQAVKDGARLTRLRQWTDLIFLDEMLIIFAALLQYFAMATIFIVTCLTMVIFFQRQKRNELLPSSEQNYLCSFFSANVHMNVKVLR